MSIELGPLESIHVGSQPLVEVTRGDLVESVHYGHVVTINPDGTTGFTLGTADAVFYPRSSAKAIQTLAMVRGGLELPPELLALVISSHSAEQKHLDGVDKILGAYGLDRTHLDCTPGYPLGPDAAIEWHRQGFGKQAVASDCSGKHSGMLATCVINGWSTQGYLQPDHPVQQLIAGHMATELGQGPVTSTDGCGAPLVTCTIEALAQAYHRVGSARPDQDHYLIANAMRTAPDMVAGTGRAVTKLMHAIPGSIAKDGAEAILAFALPTGHAAAIKILDGGGRALSSVALMVLRRWQSEGLDIDLTDAEQAMAVATLGHGQPVGAVQPSRVH